MDGVDPKAFEIALAKVDDGFLFENFSQAFLSGILGYTFLPVGGLKDRGIDGLQHVYHREGFDRNIYQSSIEKSSDAKLEKTIEKLRDNKIEYETLYYVTNQPVQNKDRLIDTLFEKHKKPVHIFDVNWFSARVNHSAATINAYKTFILSYLHEFEQPGKSYVISNLVHDPRLFVFLRQQWDVYRRDLNLDVILADTLILYCLEGTDPDKSSFKTASDIKRAIAHYIKFDPKLLHATIDKRLLELSQRPRRINYHSKMAGYCLPYVTRLRIQERNLKDAMLHETFKATLEYKFVSYLKEAQVKVKDCIALIEQTIHKLFYQQGIEFADFVLKGENASAFEKDLPTIISMTVDESSVVTHNREEVKSALLMTIRDTVYNGTPEQKLFLKRLSNTYMMLFLLQCDPKIAAYFNSMASKLNVYVCTSILIPALSEFYLDPVNRRHWNLLKGARNAGVKIIINEPILRELCAHFQFISDAYEKNYSAAEDIYLGDEIQTLYIPEIMIRAYFYAKMRDKVRTFHEFIDNFASPDLRNAEDELIEWLKEEFGIEYRSDKSCGVTIDPVEEESLYEELKKVKHGVTRTRSDTRIILTIFAIRELQNETATAGITGYKTWWLSKDTLTQKVVNEVFGSKYKMGCYLRPDFLYNYISLAPTKAEVDAAYQELFPSLIGVNISFHLPNEVTNFIHKQIADHRVKNPARLKAILRELGERLKVDPNARTRQYVEHYFDTELKRMSTR